MCTNADGFQGEPIKINIDWRKKMVYGDVESVDSSIQDAIENLKAMENLVDTKQRDLQDLADTVETAKDKVENVHIQVSDAISALENIEELNTLVTEAVDDADELIDR